MSGGGGQMGGVVLRVSGSMINWGCGVWVGGLLRLMTMLPKKAVFLIVYTPNTHQKCMENKVLWEEEFVRVV